MYFGPYEAIAFILSRRCEGKERHLALTRFHVASRSKFLRMPHICYLRSRSSWMCFLREYISPTLCRRVPTTFARVRAPRRACSSWPTWPSARSTTWSKQNILYVLVVSTWWSACIVCVSRRIVSLCVNRRQQVFDRYSQNFGNTVEETDNHIQVPCRVVWLSVWRLRAYDNIDILSLDSELL